MRATKTGRRTGPKKKSAAKSLANRVRMLEEDMHEMRTRMVDLGSDLSALRTTVKHVDERTLRGEKLMTSIQIDQRYTARVVDAIAEKLHVVLPPVVARADLNVVSHEIEDDDLDKPEL